MKKLTFTALALMMCGAAWAAAIPQASRYDSRVQQVIYNPQNVTVVNTKPGFMTTLVFDNDEAVISAKPGFDEAWEATPDANRVNVRPVALTQGAPGEDGNTTQVVIPPNSRDWHTNMLVVTSKRLYNVELNVIDDKSAQQPAFGELSLSGRRTGQSEPGGDGQTARVGAETATGQRPESAELGADAPQLELHQISGQRQFQHCSRFCLRRWPLYVRGLLPV